MGNSNSPSKVHLQRDPVFAPLVQSLRLEPLDTSSDVYFRLLRAIVFQQLSGKAASTIFGRFQFLFPGGYPAPELLLKLTVPDLRLAGLSNQKAQYVQNVATYFLEKDLIRQDWSRLPDEEIQDQLVAIKGVGEWTVQMILIFTLGRKDILPLGDLAIRQSIEQLYQLQGTRRELHHQMLKVAEKWRPYRSVASRYLWTWKDAQAVGQK
jgi:DNA-3-methyladenine glycosylase II